MAKILIVEDESILALNISMDLQSMGHQVVGIADNANEAISIATAEKPEIILMDIKIKGTINGFHLAEHTSIASGKVIFMSGSSSGSANDKSGRKIKLNKPFSAEELETAINQAIED